MMDAPDGDLDLEDDIDAETDVYASDVDDDITGTTDVAGADLRELVTYLASNLVDAPDEVRVSFERRGSAVHLRLQVPEEDLGKVIGRQGRIARAMRTAVMIAGARHDVRASVDIEG